MDFRRMRLFSFRNGYDLRDCSPSSGPRSLKAIVARRIRKQEKAMLARSEEREAEAETHAVFSNDLGYPVERFWEEYDEVYT